MAPLTGATMKRLVSRLGKDMDISLATEFGVTRERIRQLRVERGIPVFKATPMPCVVPVRFTRIDDKTMKRAIKVTGHKNQSEYVRDAVAEKNEAVLKGGKG